MIYCPGCGTANRDGSRFCNECGSKLPTTTSSLCPTCGTPNPPNSLYCLKCGTRLIASLADESTDQETVVPGVPVRKGLSLPTKPGTGEASLSSAPSKPEAAQAPPVPEEALNWMNVLQSAATESPELAPAGPAGPTAAQPQTEEVPDWLSGLNLVEPTTTPPTPVPEDDLPEWAQRLRTASAAPEAAAESEEMPDWLKTLGSTAAPAGSTELPPPFETKSAAPLQPAASEEEMPAWMQDIPAESEAVLKTGLEVPSSEPQPAARADLPDWLRALRPTESPRDDLPDWLDDLAAEASQEISQSAEAEGVSEPASDSALDWVSQLADTGPLKTPPSEQITAPEEFSALPSTFENPEAEVPSWLSGLGAAAAVSSAEAKPPAGEEQPDWLSRPFEVSASSSTPPSEEAPDWLSGLRAATPPTEEGPSTQPVSTGELSNWLQELQSESQGGLGPSMPESKPSAEESVPGGLAGAGEMAKPEEQPATEEQPDWLSALRGAAPEISEEAPPEMAEENAPDWLAALGVAGVTAAAAKAVSEPEEAQPSEAGTPDWLAMVSAAGESAEQPAAEEQPDWLSALRGSTPQIEESPAGEPAASIEPPSTEGQPDWLAALRGSAQPIEETSGRPTSEEPSTTPSAEEPSVEGGPDWLAQLAATQPSAEEAAGSGDWMSALRAAAPELDQQPAETEEPAWLQEAETSEPMPSEPLAEVPDWLHDLGAAEPAAAPPAELPPAQPSEGGVPDWLKDIGVVAGAAAVAHGLAESKQPEEEIPDWLRDMGEQPAPALKLPEVPEWLAETEQAPEEPGLAEVPDWLRAPSAHVEPSAGVHLEEPEHKPEPETPEWLRDLAPAAGAVAVGTQPAGEIQPPGPIEEEAPEETAQESRDWIKAAAPAAVAAVAAAGLAARKPKEEAAPAELPEWLQQLRQEQAAAPAQSTLIQAEIPAWLEALRPTEAIEAEKPAEGEVETQGPLAGLVGALPAAAAMGQIQGTLANLHYEVSADDQARAGVLKELMIRPASAPRKTESFVVKSAPFQRRMLRWFITALLVVGIVTIPNIDWNGWVFKPLLGNNLLPSLQTLEVPPATQQAVSQIAALQAGTPVLVVFDYDASQSDEMNHIAEVFFAHLLARGAHIEVVSLNPQGPGIAQLVWQKVSDGKSAELFKNSGFIPGQAAGVQSVLNASNPAVIIDLAASPDTIRWWAEQLTLNGRPVTLVAGISAGAETLTLPYVKSGQVQGGMVVGASGALAYSKGAQLPLHTMDEFELEAITVASWLMAILVLVALIMAVVSILGKRSAK